jgi:hypothetical protein
LFVFDVIIQQLSKHLTHIPTEVASFIMTPNIQLPAPEQTTKRPRLVSTDSSTPFKGPKGKNVKAERKSCSLPSETVEYLKAWMMSPEHISHPYPTEQEKLQIMADTSVEMKQLTNWFVNNRKRYWKPRVEARLQQQAHAAAAHTVKTTITDVTVVNPVSPDGAFRQKNTLPPSSGFVSCDLCPPPQTPEKPQNRQMVSAAFTSFLLSPSSVHTVSEASSSASVAASESDSIASSTEEDFSSTPVELSRETQTETVDVHILRPLLGEKLTLEDVTFLPNVPSERIVKTFENCLLTFKFSTSDAKKVSSLHRWTEKMNFAKSVISHPFASSLFADAKSTRCRNCSIEEALFECVH